MTQSGWRKPTPGLLQAERFAEVGERLSISKTQSLVAVKKVAAVLGLKAQDLLLLDTFGAVTQPQDWEAGRRPIVWASNQFLIEQTGFSLATLRRHVRRLCEVGVISMKDSPNGKRWGRRDAEGVILEAYGFDLSPLAARAEEFERLYDAVQQDRAERAALRTAITVTRRMIRAKIEQALSSRLRGPWTQLHESFRALMTDLPKRSEGAGGLGRFLSEIKRLLVSVEASFEAAYSDHAEPTSKSKEMTPRRAVNDTHIQTTNEPNPVNCNCFETKPDLANPEAKQTHGPIAKTEREGLDIAWDTHQRKATSDFDISTVMASCPHFAQMAHSMHGYMRNWTDMHRAATALRPVVGISEDAWAVANDRLGPVAAAASLALILDKTTTGEVKSPGGYLRGLVERAQTGALHLERSFYGRLNGAGA